MASSHAPSTSLLLCKDQDSLKPSQGVAVAAVHSRILQAGGGQRPPFLHAPAAVGSWEAVCVLPAAVVIYQPPESNWTFWHCPQSSCSPDTHSLRGPDFCGAGHPVPWPLVCLSSVLSQSVTGGPTEPSHPDCCAAKQLVQTALPSHGSCSRGQKEMRA